MKHHYVPAFYLRSFIDPACPAGYKPYLWVVDLVDGTIRRQSPKNTASLTDYYAVGDGDDRYDVEKCLGAVENVTAPALARILDDLQVIEGDDKRVVSHFAALQLVRVPQFRDRIEAFMTGAAQTINALMIQSRDGWEEALREASPGRDFTAEEVDKLYAFASDVNNYTLSANPAAVLGHALDVVPAIAALLNSMSWVIMEPAGADNFWSSDNPLYYINPESKHPFFGHALAAKGVEVNFPIGPRRCLLMMWTEPRGPRARIVDISTAQQRGIAGAKRDLFCGTEQDAIDAFDAHRRFFKGNTTNRVEPTSVW